MSFPIRRIPGSAVLSCTRRWRDLDLPTLPVDGASREPLLDARLVLALWYDGDLVSNTSPRKWCRPR